MSRFPVKKIEFIEGKITLLNGVLMTKKSIYSFTPDPTMVSKKLLSKKKNKHYEKIIDFIDEGLNLALSFSIGPIGTTIYQALQTNSNFKDKMKVLLTGLGRTLDFFVLKISFPPLIPVFSFLQNLSVLTLTEIVTSSPQ